MEQIRAGARVIPLTDRYEVWVGKKWVPVLVSKRPYLGQVEYFFPAKTTKMPNPITGKQESPPAIAYEAMARAFPATAKISRRSVIGESP